MHGSGGAKWAWKKSAITAIQALRQFTVVRVDLRGQITPVLNHNMIVDFVVSMLVQDKVEARGRPRRHLG